MEIVGLGTEIVESVRIRELIDRYADHFLRKVFTESEIRACQSPRLATERFAGHWAAKEAVRKCLEIPGTRVFPWAEVEIRLSGSKRPRAILTGAAKERARDLMIGDFMISLAHTRHYAMATVIAIRTP